MDLYKKLEETRIQRNKIIHKVISLGSKIEINEVAKDATKIMSCIIQDSWCMHNAKTISENHFTYLEFPFELRRMIYTTNAIERLNKEVKKVVKNKNSFPNPESALSLIWMKIMDRVALYA